MRSLALVALLASAPAAAAPAPHARSRIIYLNRHGATLSPGVNDSRTQRSSVVAEPRALPPWEGSEDAWAATVACMRATWSRFDVEITDVDPGSVDHLEAILGGSPDDAGLPSNVTGAAPQAADCSVIEDGIALTFTAILPADPDQVCAVTSHELGHLYGLDHELLAADPMSYLPFSGARAFQDVEAACGETTARPCACGAMQSSVQLLLTRLGSAGEGEITPVADTDPDTDTDTDIDIDIVPAFAPAIGGCTSSPTSGAAAGGVIAAALLGGSRRKRLRPRRHRGDHGR